MYYGYYSRPRRRSCISRFCFAMAVVLLGTVLILAATGPTNAVTRALSPGSPAQGLVRINQLDCKQYASIRECATWRWSTCSTAAMAEVLSYYGKPARITDVLAYEWKIKEITPQDGLLHDKGINLTLAHFGLAIDLSYKRTLDQVIDLASSGIPVIVAWPPSRYSHGHIVVVRGGNKSQVLILDSSTYNRKAVSRTQFMAWWGSVSWAIGPERSMKL